MKFRLFIHDQSDNNKLLTSTDISGTQKQILHESQELTKTYLQRRFEIQCQNRKLDFNSKIMSVKSPTEVHMANPVYTLTLSATYFTEEFNSMQRHRITLVKLED